MKINLSTSCKQNLFEANRQRLFEKFQAEVIILCGASEQYRNHDTEADFRQNSDFMYLTGVETIRDAVVVFDSFSQQTNLFVPDQDNSYPVWHGALRTLEELKDTYQVSDVYGTANPSELTKDGRKVLTLQEKKDIVPDSSELQIDIEEKSEELRNVLDQIRAVKSEYEIEVIAEACRISCEAHIELMKNCQPGYFEYQLESLFKHMTSWKGYQAYIPIVGSGTTSAILHYSDNCKQIQDGELVLVDAGCELMYYASDITRTFPANGTFSPQQKLLYNLVLNVQKSLIEMLTPGLDFRLLSRTCYILLAEGLIEAGFLLSCTAEEAVEKRLIHIFMPHGLGHLMGLDVHDTTIYPKNMVITIEPGVYFNKFLIEEALANPEVSPYLNETLLREYLEVGGVRIEDDVVITSTTPRVLTSLAPKEISDIEELMRSEK